MMVGRTGVAGDRDGAHLVALEHLDLRHRLRRAGNQRCGIGAMVTGWVVGRGLGGAL